jgi:hypothetical protein
MSPLRPGRLLAFAAATACVIALAACGSGEPSDNPTATDSGQGQFGEASATPTATTSTTTTPTPTSGGGGGGGGSGGGGGGGGGATSSYPNDATEYGLAILQAIAADNDARIVDLSNLNVGQYVDSQNYKAKNGQWTNANCENGVPTMCFYYNQTGDIATVTIDAGKLGQKSAVSGVTIEGGSFPNDAVGYAQALAQTWTFSGRYVEMRALATQSVITFLNGVQKLNAGNGGVGAQSATCPSGQSGTCVEVYAVGGSLTISYVFVVDSSKLGKPNAVIAAVPTP